MAVKLVPEGKIARTCDTLMRPFMYVVSGTCWEAPQGTHAWNWHKITHAEAGALSTAMMVTSPGRHGECGRHHRLISRYHMPVFGGWRRYIVLEPVTHSRPWYVGWITTDQAGVSRIPIAERVRVLEGPEPTRWFGLDDCGSQVVIWECGKGKIGEGGPFVRIPLR